MESTSSILDNIPIPPKPMLLGWSGISGLSLLGGLAVACGVHENWFGLALNVGLMGVVLLGCYIAYLAQSSLWRKYQRLLCVDRLITTPVMREDGHSLIFTFLSPSPEMLPEVNDFFKEIRENNNEGEKS